MALLVCGELLVFSSNIYAFLAQRFFNIEYRLKNDECRSKVSYHLI